MTIDLAERVAKQQHRDARTRELDAREREHGGLVPGDRESESRRRSVKGWGPYRPDVTVADVAIVCGAAPIDPRRVTIGRLYVDCGAAVRRFARKYRGHAADTLRDDALLLLLAWESHGAAEKIDLGGTGGCPMRRDWLEGNDKLTRCAWRALHAAVKQASETPSFLSLATPDATLTDPLDIARAVEDQQCESDAPARLPDAAAPEVVGSAMDLPLDAARAIVARAYPAASARELASQWGMSEGTLKVALSRGAAVVRERYPDPTDLLDALEAAGATWRAESEGVAILSLIDYRDGCGAADDALSAVRDWRGAEAELPAEHRALLGAARSAAKRNGRTYGGERAERVAMSVRRIHRAELGRGRTLASAAARGSHLDGTRESASTQQLGRLSKPPRAVAPAIKVIGPESFPRPSIGDGYGGCCSCLYLYREGGRRQQDGAQW